MKTRRRYLYFRVIILLTCLCLSAGLGAVLASCGRGVTGSAEASPTLEQSRPLSEHPPLSRSLRIPPAPSLTRQIAEKHDQNADTVGWLQVPGTGIDDVVVHHPHDQNEFYLRRNFDRRTSMAGAYFADFRNTFNGRAGGLSRNTVIYGHSLSLDDDPDAPYFDQLKRFLDEDFARANPYIFFSLAEEDLVWQIFAVYYATVALPYNHPDFDDGAFADIVLEMQKRSEFIYDVEVGPDDKILTLSTCTYVFTPGVHPNRYRFVVSARLMREGETRGEAAGLTRNPAPKDP